MVILGRVQQVEQVCGVRHENVQLVEFVFFVTYVTTRSVNGNCRSKGGANTQTAEHMMNVRPMLYLYRLAVNSLHIMLN